MKFRKKPVVIDAFQLGNNIKKIGDVPDEFLVPSIDYIKIDKGLDTEHWIAYVNTMEGRMHVSKNDWIIKGVNGEFYPCKPGVFEKTYEKV